MSSPSLAEFVDVMSSYVRGEISADEYANRYFALFRRIDGEPYSAAAAKVIDDLFVDIDCLSNDSTQFPDDVLSAQDVRESTVRALATVEAVGSV